MQTETPARGFPSATWGPLTKRKFQHGKAGRASVARRPSRKRSFSRSHRENAGRANVDVGKGVLENRSRICRRRLPSFENRPAPCRETKPCVSYCQSELLLLTCSGLQTSAAPTCKHRDFRPRLTANIGGPGPRLFANEPDINCQQPANIRVGPDYLQTAERAGRPHTGNPAASNWPCSSWVRPGANWPCRKERISAGRTLSRSASARVL